jgi:hypothetical protein
VKVGGFLLARQTWCHSALFAFWKIREASEAENLGPGECLRCDVTRGIGNEFGLKM